ncbi:MFS transporter [Burkholderia ubonensis]|uniref:MFS transporter n=1 Tax=Burkholderia ubonensis TaxID=101571 RepID=A0A107E8E0_9BURK|nr:MFS transporter [Burkholderia ubonensis]AOK59141.1 MFS transporter [Burkholderia ubonensis]KWD70502.1 MFS transporter [Burkholderia ubonensis]KWD89105.1 MFS transporter [Burkholderia ubonensis]KWD95052.1 MFS transporter [Burkholderia ubonensis]KWE04479.1 MFS transporter [Burkholderia ubonensis]
MQTPSKHHSCLVQIAACLGFVVVLIDVSVVNVALDALRTVFRADVTGLQWVVNAYALVFASTLLMAGALGDRLGARRMFMTGYAIFALSSIGCGVAQSMEALIAWRLVQGVGASLLVPNSLAVLRLAFQDPAARSRAIGWWGAGGGIALAAGPLTGGLLVAAFGWRSIFLVNVPVGIAGIWMTWRFVPGTQAQRGRSLDLPGQLTGAFALAALTFASTEVSALGWRSPIILAAFALCVGLSIAFIRLEARNPAAMLPVALWQNRIVRSASMVGMIANLVFYGIVFTLSLLFQSIWHTTPVGTGVAFLPMMGILMVMNLVAGRLASRVGARVLATAGLLISAVGYLAMLPALAAQSRWLLALPMLLAGSGIALTIPTITDAMLAAVCSAQSGIASGLLNAARQVGGVMGVALFGFFVRHTGMTLFVDGMKQALVVSVLLLVIGAATAWRNLDSVEPAQ